MSRAHALGHHLADLVGRAQRGPCLMIGPLAVARVLRDHRPDVLVVEPHLPPRKLARKRGDTPVIRAHPLALPVARRSLALLLAVDVMGQLPSPTDVVHRWSRALRPGGQLLVVSPVRRGSPLDRLRGRAPDAESLCGALLAAGLGPVSQAPVDGAGATTVTGGALRLLPLDEQ